jgi:hypothetical protein
MVSGGRAGAQRSGHFLACLPACFGPTQGWACRQAWNDESGGMAQTSRRAGAVWRQASDRRRLTHNFGMHGRRRGMHVEDWRMGRGEAWCRPQQPARHELFLPEVGQARHAWAIRGFRDSLPLAPIRFCSLPTTTASAGVDVDAWDGRVSAGGKFRGVGGGTGCRCGSGNFCDLCAWGIGGGVPGGDRAGD